MEIAALARLQHIYVDYIQTEQAEAMLTQLLPIRSNCRLGKGVPGT